MTSTDELCVNTLRFLAVDAVEKARSGHPGLPLGAAPMAYVLFDRFLKHDPADPGWWDRDRFVLSPGHGSALLYALLHCTGYPVTLDDLQHFREWGSITPGHPEHGVTPGVEATTGPLGQGFAMGLGMAIAEHHLAAVYNRPGLPVFDHFTYGIVSDGDLMEGITSEAASLAATLGLGKLVYLYDNNKVSLEGDARVEFTESVPTRFRAYGWDVRSVEDGNDLAEIESAIRGAREAVDRPSLISVRTHIGYGSPVQDSHEAHGEPLGPEGTRETKQRLGWPVEPPFLVPPEARAHFEESRARGALRRQEWLALYGRWKSQEPALAPELERRMKGELPVGWADGLPVFQPKDGPLATRDASGTMLNALAKRFPEILGGSADLAPSTKTLLTSDSNYGRGNPGGRNLHFGVREHAMVAMVNGLALHGGMLPYGATFLVFSDYARGAIRLSALMQVPMVLVLTHDSIAVGEDGPTHEPVEHLLSLRAIPGLLVLRPADANETRAAWKIVVSRRKPTMLILTRQKLPVLPQPPTQVDQGVERGAYVLSPAEGGRAQALLLATGSEVHLALEAQRRLLQEGTRVSVVSMPSWELFDAQPAEYRSQVLPDALPRVSVEAGVTIGWGRYVGLHGASVGVDRFGASAPGPIVQQKLGLTPEHVVDAVRSVLTPSGAGGSA
ncbi:MAG: transketolase [Euryarchaeota archaeon]|nr:transketolase [Euryarchaeota archaeon]MDE1836966.1 transketolase [Euryarchaeota archaeon]MDE1880786.1 transketolase [Euryarchaeota archaeon]MDE2045849.1 transketolase [Thermoplasmata archaeon]